MRLGRDAAGVPPDAAPPTPFAGVRVLLLDFDDTLVASSGADAAALRDTLSRYRDAFRADNLEELVRHHERILLDVKRVFHETGVWAYPPERLGRLLAERGGDPALAEEMGAHYLDVRLRNLRPFPGVFDFIERLRGRGYRVGIVTNGPARQRQWLDRLGFLPRVDAVAIAGEEDVRKPDPRLFRLALERAGGAAPAEVAVAGDSFEMDVLPARSLGYRTAYVAGAPGDVRSRIFDNLPPPDPADAVADAVVARVTDLEPLLPG